MPQDVVIDTNVFMHSSNPNTAFGPSSKDFLEHFEKSKTQLCYDVKDDASKANFESSLILGEYRRKMAPGAVGYAILARLASGQRLKPVSRQLDAKSSRAVNDLLPGNKRDRTFLRVAINSTEKLLISNDLEDFTDQVRQKIAGKFNVRVITVSTKWSSI